MVCGGRESGLCQQVPQLLPASAQVEELKLLSTAEKLGLLSLAEKALTSDPGIITSASIVPFLAAIGAPTTGRRPGTSGAVPTRACLDACLHAQQASITRTVSLQWRDALACTPQCESLSSCCFLYQTASCQGEGACFHEPCQCRDPVGNPIARGPSRNQSSSESCPQLSWQCCQCFRAGALVFIPQDNVLESVLRLVAAGSFFTVFAVLFAGGFVVGALQEE